MMSTWLLRVSIFGLALVVIVGCSQPKTDAAPTPKPTAAPKAPKTAAAPASTAKSEVPAAPRQASAQSKPAATPKSGVLAPLPSWDFAKLDAATSGWWFAGKTTKTPDGIAFEMTEAGPALRLLSGKVVASDATSVRVSLSVTQEGPADKAVPVRLLENPQFFWARAEELRKTEGKWPFNIGMRRGLPEQAPGIWEGKLEGRINWEGTITQLMIDLKLPGKVEEGDTPYTITVRKIEFFQ